MTPRRLRWTAFAVALAIVGATMFIHGAGTRWCFCAITTTDPAPEISTFALRFMELGMLPMKSVARWMPRGLLPVQGLYLVAFLAWFLVVLGLLSVLALGARVRVGRGIRLVGRERVRPAHLLIGVCILLAAAMMVGAMQRRAWLRQAEQVFAATMAATAGGGLAPPGVEFSMYAMSGDTSYVATPEGRYETRVDARRAGDHFFDQFVLPYEYGGMLRSESGALYFFTVSATKDGWSVFVHPPMSSRP